MPRTRALLAMSCILLAACATPVAPLDNSPQNQTAYIEEYTHNFGFKGFFANEATQQEYVRDDAQRTPESTLQLCALLGGWPGALLAQQVFRHKSSKRSFQVIFWLTVVLNCGVLGFVTSPTGAALVRQMLEAR